MFFNARKRAAARELEVAIHYLLHGAPSLVPLLKETYKDKWPGFIDDILAGARPYEEAMALIRTFVRSSFESSDRGARDQIVLSIGDNNLVNPPDLLRIVGQVCYTLYLAEQGKDVRKKLWTVWVNDMADMFADAGNSSVEHCISYFMSLANSYRDEMRTEQLAARNP
jgi:hypothetical protein